MLNNLAIISIEKKMAKNWTTQVWWMSLLIRPQEELFSKSNVFSSFKYFWTFISLFDISFFFHIYVQVFYTKSSPYLFRFWSFKTQDRHCCYGLYIITLSKPIHIESAIGERCSKFLESNWILSEYSTQVSYTFLTHEQEHSANSKK